MPEWETTEFADNSVEISGRKGTWDISEWEIIELAENSIEISGWRSQKLPKLIIEEIVRELWTPILSVKFWEIHFIDFPKYVNIIY